MVKIPVCYKLGEECIGKLGAIVSTEYLRDAMSCEEFLQDWDGLGGTALRCRNSADDGNLGVVIYNN